MLDQDELLPILKDADDAASIPERLIESAKQAGGHDNITAVVMIP